MNVQLLSIVSAGRLTVLLAVLAVFFSGISPAEDYPALDVPADIALKVNKASSPQSPYSSGHSVNQAIDGSLESANWHAPVRGTWRESLSLLNRPPFITCLSPEPISTKCPFLS